MIFIERSRYEGFRKLDRQAYFNCALWQSASKDIWQKNIWTLQLTTTYSKETILHNRKKDEGKFTKIFLVLNLTRFQCYRLQARWTSGNIWIENKFFLLQIKKSWCWWWSRPDESDKNCLLSDQCNGRTSYELIIIKCCI